MNLIHIVVGDIAAKNIVDAMALEPNMQGSIVVLKDTLGIGQIFVTEADTYKDIRTNFWKTIVPNWPEDETVIDEDLIKEVVSNLNEETKVWFWMAPCISDVMAYYWLLPYFKNHPQVLHTLFINSLPFFNEKGNLFYPKNFGEVLPKEVVKCMRLAKDVSPADYEIDGDEWERLANENATIRSYEGGKKILSRNENYYDQALLNQLQFTNGFVKANKVVAQALAKITDTLSNYFLEQRLRLLISEEKIQAQGDITKALKDFEVKKLGGEA